MRTTILSAISNKNEAKLVITPRIHCAMPCIAMDIPVILIIKNIANDSNLFLKLVFIMKSARIIIGEIYAKQILSIEN